MRQDVTIDMPAGPAGSPQGEPQSAEPKLRSVAILGLRFSHMRTQHAGWAQAEGHSASGQPIHAMSVVSLVKMLEGGKLTGFRLVIGRHSFWVMG